MRHWEDFLGEKKWRKCPCWFWTFVWHCNVKSAVWTTTLLQNGGSQIYGSSLTTQSSLSRHIPGKTECDLVCVQEPQHGEVSDWHCVAWSWTCQPAISLQKKPLAIDPFPARPHSLFRGGVRGAHRCRSHIKAICQCSLPLNAVRSPAQAKASHSSRVTHKCKYCGADARTRFARTALRTARRAPRVGRSITSLLSARVVHKKATDNFQDSRRARSVASSLSLASALGSGSVLAWLSRLLLRRTTGVDVLRVVLRQIRPLTFDLWPLPYKEKITWYVYILPEMTSYVYSDMRSYLHVYITCTSREHRVYLIAPAKTRSKFTWRAKYSIFTLSLQVQNEPRHWARAENRFYCESTSTMSSQTYAYIPSVSRSVCEKS